MGLILLYWLLIAVMLIGVVGAIVPAVPGSSLILGSIIVWGLVTGFANITWSLTVVIIVLILSLGVDFLATYWGAKRTGASSWSQIGAFVGLGLGFVGLLPALPFGGPLFGILVGPLLGAFIGEFLYRRNLDFGNRIKTAFKVCLGVVVGSLVGNLIEGLLALIAVIVFVVTTWPPGAVI